MVTLTCEHCKNDFVVNMTGRSKRNRRFCSHKCSVEATRLNYDEYLDKYKDGKICSSCKVYKPICDFVKKGNSSSSYCRKCLYLFQMRRWNKNKIRAIEYLGGVCVKCNKPKHPCLIDFHHKSDDKECEWGKLRQKSWDKIMKELDKCDLMCCECHRLHHINHDLWKFPEDE